MESPLKWIEIIEWLRTQGPKYWLHIVLVIIALFAVHLWRENERLREVVSSLELRVEDYEGCRTESPEGDPPLRVTFSDDRVAFVNFFHVTVPTNQAAYSTTQRHAWFHRYEGFLNSLKSSVYTELESVELSYARKHREQMVDRIVKRLEPTASVLEFELVQIELLGFCEPFSVAGRTRTR